MEDLNNSSEHSSSTVIEQPLWVALAFSMIEKKKHAIWLILANLLFALYCIPWTTLIPENSLVTTIFKIEDWSWIAILVPILIWYFFCYRWMSKNNAWKD